MTLAEVAEEVREQSLAMAARARLTAGTLPVGGLLFQGQFLGNGLTVRVLVAAPNYMRLRTVVARPMPHLKTNPLASGGASKTVPIKALGHPGYWEEHFIEVVRRAIANRYGRASVDNVLDSLIPASG